MERRQHRCSTCGKTGHNRTTCGRHQGDHKYRPRRVTVEKCGVCGSPAPEPIKVFIAWFPDGPGSEAPDIVNTLTSYYGTRVYVRDLYDGRLDLGREGLPPRPYFDSVNDAFDHMAKNRGSGGTCQIDVRLRVDLGWGGPFNEYLPEGVPEGLPEPARCGIIHHAGCSP